MYQYRGYTIQLTDFSWIVRDGKGKYIIQTVSDKEAEEWIDDLLDNKGKPNIDWYERFEVYCKNMPYKLYIDGKLASSDDRTLQRYIKSFEKHNDVRVIYSSKYKGGEHILVVEDVI